MQKTKASILPCLILLLVFVAPLHEAGDFHSADCTYCLNASGPGLTPSHDVSLALISLEDDFVLEPKESSFKSLDFLTVLSQRGPPGDVSFVFS